MATHNKVQYCPNPVQVNLAVIRRKVIVLLHSRTAVSVIRILRGVGGRGLGAPSYPIMVHANGVVDPFRPPTSNDRLPIQSGLFHREKFQKFYFVL